MKHPIVSRLTFVAVCLFAAAEVHARSYLLVAHGNNLPTNLTSAVTAAGGSVTRLLPQVGIAIVESSNAQFAAQMRSITGIGSVLTNVQWKTAEPLFGLSEAIDDSAVTPSAAPVVVTDSRFVLQWSLTAINAPGAWALG